MKSAGLADRRLWGTDGFLKLISEHTIYMIIENLLGSAFKHYIEASSLW